MGSLFYSSGEYSGAATGSVFMVLGPVFGGGANSVGNRTSSNSIRLVSIRNAVGGMAKNANPTTAINNLVDLFVMISPALAGIRTLPEPDGVGQDKNWSDAFNVIKPAYDRHPLNHSSIDLPLPCWWTPLESRIVRVGSSY